MSKLGLKIFASSLVGMILLSFLNIYLIISYNELSVTNVEKLRVENLAKKFIVLRTEMTKMVDNVAIHGVNPDSLVDEHEFLASEMEKAKNELIKSGASDKNLSVLNEEFSSLDSKVSKVFSLERDKKIKTAEYEISYVTLNGILDDIVSSSKKNGLVAAGVKNQLLSSKDIGTNDMELKNGYENLTGRMDDSTDLYLAYSRFMALRIELQDISLKQKYYADFAKKELADFSLSANEVLNKYDLKYSEFLNKSDQNFYLSIAGLIIAFFSGLILMYFTTRNIILPVLELTEVAKKVSAGDLKERLVVKSHDEIGYLSSVFNDMIMVLENFQRETKENETKLQELNSKLEEKVAVRTKELENIKNNLEKMVNERTSELQSKVDELEKFRELTVGRELKMISLKQELEKLSSKKDN